MYSESLCFTFLSKQDLTSAPFSQIKYILFPSCGCFSFFQSTTAKTLLSFVNEKTKKKFLITNQMDAVCKELGWDKAEVEECGGVTEFMHKHEKAGDTLLFEWRMNVDIYHIKWRNKRTQTHKESGV